jgi:hypothetical protein
MELHRIDPKHYRWYQEIVAGGSLLIHRPGASALHKGPDGLSRNVEGRDHLILAKDTEWIKFRDRVKGICAAIHSGEADDDDAEATTVEAVEKSNPEVLKPLPHAQGLAVSLKYEKGSQERKFKSPPRGDEAKATTPAAAKAKAKAASSTSFSQARGGHTHMDLVQERLKATTPTAAKAKAKAASSTSVSQARGGHTPTHQRLKAMDLKTSANPSQRPKKQYQKTRWGDVEEHPIEEVKNISFQDSEVSRLYARKAPDHV